MKKYINTDINIGGIFMVTDGPLSGIKVVELATFVAAPVVGRMLADMGAEVIKIEAPSGDGWRATGISYLPKRFSKDENPVFDIYNSGKKFASLNLKTPEGKEAFFKLLEDADVFLTNNRPVVLKRLGLAYEDLKEKYPRLIYALILGYGEKGPDKDALAFDTTAFWSRGGFLRDLAPKTSEYYPITPPSGVGDTTTGYLLLAEIATALYNRTRTGKGDIVRSGLYRSGIFTFGTMQIITQKPFGSVYPAHRKDLGVPSGSYECSDGEWIYFGLAAAGSMEKLCQITGTNHLLEDPEFVPAKRYGNRHIYYPMFRDIFLSQPSSYWIDRAREVNLPLVRMQHFSDISEDPQAWENGYVEHVQFRNGNVDVMPASPVDMGSCTPPSTQPAPLVGADTAAVLAQLGYTDEQIQAMLATGAAMAPKEN